MYGSTSFVPRPGMIRPVLRDPSSSGSDSESENDNGSIISGTSDADSFVDHSATNDRHNRSVEDENEDHGLDIMAGRKRPVQVMNLASSTTPREIQTFQSSTGACARLDRQPPPRHAFPIAISSPFSDGPSVDLVVNNLEDNSDGIGIGSSNCVHDAELSLSPVFKNGVPSSATQEPKQGKQAHSHDNRHPQIVLCDDNPERPAMSGANVHSTQDAIHMAVQSIDISRGSQDSNIATEKEKEGKVNMDRLEPSPSISQTNVQSSSNHGLHDESSNLSMDTLHNLLTAETHEYDNYDEIEQMQATFGDFLPVATFQDDDSLEDGMSLGTSITEREGNDYMLLENGCHLWEENSDDDGDEYEGTCRRNFTPSMNCHGIVHVRLLRIQHLPCSKGSSLQAIVSLPPWKGRIKSEKVLSYRGPSKAGICARWDTGGKKKTTNESKDEWDDSFVPLVESDHDKASIPCISMVHAYNNEETPVPTISIELKDVALMFERTICNLNLSCEPLMCQPGVFRKRWCSVNRENAASTDIKKGERTGGEDGDNAQIPLFLIEACFEPTDFGDAKSSGELLGDDMELDEASRSLDDIRELQSDMHDTLDTHHRKLQQQTPIKLIIGKKQMTKKRLKSRPHMFRNYSSLRPTYCALCNTMIAWKLKGYQCEVCKLDCCADCQLRIDVEMPCGSEKAADTVKRISESKLTLSKIYEVIAPKKAESEPSTDYGSNVLSLPMEGKRGWRDGVGTISLRIKKACLFRHNFAPEANLSHILEVSDRWLRTGDYYARVSWTDGTDTKRTRTVFQTAKPRFDSDDIVITSLHYGTEFKIEVVDASTDMAIGTKLLTTQGLLQWQRDNIGWGLSLSSLVNEEPISLQKTAVCMELRTNVKTGFGIDFFNASRISDNSRAGEISGWIELDVSFEENPDLYSFSNPRPCPPRPADDFNVELIQLHIARITAIIEDFWSAIDSYTYVISWKNPALTSLSLLIFIAACLRLNSEYIGSFPFALVIIFMLHAGRMRKTGGGFRVRLLKKETEEKVKEMIGNAVKYKKHRPVAELEVAVLKGRNLAPNHRIPGSLVASIIWDPLKFADEYTRKSTKEIDPTSCGLHQIGETEGSGMTSAPEWRLAHPSNDLERMKQLLPSKNFLSRTNSSATLNIDFAKEGKRLDSKSLNFPILQPISSSNQRTEEDLTEEEDGVNIGVITHENIQLLPWESSKGAIIIQVRFADVLNKLPIFDQILGDVVIPVSRLAKEGVIKGWFQVLEKGTLRTAEATSTDDVTKVCSSKDAAMALNRLVGTETEVHALDSKILDVTEQPAIYLEAKLQVPNTNEVSDIDKETSIVIAEHLIRSIKAKEDNGLGFLGTSINTFNTVTGVRGNVQNLQNQLGNALDMIEIVKNLFNFTCPEKSGIILIAVAALWFILIIIPTRYIVLLGGLAQYAVTFKAAFSKNESGGVIKEQDFHEKEEYDPISTRVLNFFAGVPTNEDLRRYYFWEAVRVGEMEREILANKKRATRLSKLWKAQWFGKLELKCKTSTALAERPWEWRTIFSIIQGHRFIWWESEKDFDEGENPSGQIYFAGHSGLAGLSPLEMRELKPDEVPLVVNIFGRGASRGGEQTKISLLTPDIQSKKSLETSVLSASLDKSD